MAPSTTRLMALGLASASIAFAGVLPRYAPPTPGQDCKCYEGDECFPDQAKWDALNDAVGGRLEKVIPPAAPCYEEFEGIPTFDEAKCAEVTAGWVKQPYM
jgi:hypothetical protein